MRIPIFNVVEGQERSMGVILCDGHSFRFISPTGRDFNLIMGDTLDLNIETKVSRDGHPEEMRTGLIRLQHAGQIGEPRGPRPSAVSVNVVGETKVEPRLIRFERKVSLDE